jgi:hypothetical protein
VREFALPRARVQVMKIIGGEDPAHAPERPHLRQQLRRGLDGRMHEQVAIDPRDDHPPAHLHPEQ